MAEAPAVPQPLERPNQFVHVHQPKGPVLIGDQQVSEHYNTSLGDGNENVSITVGKDINQVTAKKIEGSFNRVVQSHQSDEVKTLLQQLSNEVAKIAAQQSTDDADATADALDTLTKEATRSAPRKEWWELSAQGIRDAALAVGAIGSTAVELTKKLSGLLFG